MATAAGRGPMVMQENPLRSFFARRLWTAARPRLSGACLAIGGSIGLLGCASASTAPRPASAGTEPTPRRLTIAQDGCGDFNGSDGSPLRAALKALGEAGGRVDIGPGRYVIRESVRIPSGIHLRGGAGVILALPPPLLLERDAAAGDTELYCSATRDLTPGTYLEVLPPEGAWARDVPRARRFVQLERCAATRLTITEPLPHALARGTRLGCQQKMLWVDSAHDVLIEQLVFDGGRDPAIPMPGHQKRSAVWVGSLFSHAAGPKAPPSRNVTLRHCVFRNWYGRGVAMYNTTDSAVIGCRFSDIADEAIDFDHFTYRCQAIGNDIRRAVFGVTINDGSDHRVEHNRIRDCDTGLIIWWLPSIDPNGLNENNVLRHNVLSGSRKKAISLGRHCRGNVVRDNFYEGLLEVLEADNDVAGNWRSSSTQAR